jgi:hypothetical protein
MFYVFRFFFQLKLLFVDECEKCKDLIHVHSFAHDFHLRSIQSCISGKTVYKSYYHLTGFLSDFSLVYPYPPGFSRNFLLTGIPIILMIVIELIQSSNFCYIYGH